MKLLELIRIYPEGQKVKLGSKVGYFYIGTVGNLRLCVEVVDSKVRKYTTDRLAEAKNSLAFILRNDMTPARYARQELAKDDPNLTADGYKAALNAWFKDVKNAKARVERWSDRAREYMPIYERDIREYSIGEMPVDEGVLRILLDGYENGAFWCTDEAKTLPAVDFVEAGRRSGERKEDEA